MNKKYKILFSLCAVLMFAFSMLMVNLQPIFAKADSLSTYNVSFVAPDNSILYSTGNYVPSGSSLQELENDNLLRDSSFLDYSIISSSNNQTIISLNDWYGGNNDFTISLLDDGINVFTTSNGWFRQDYVVDYDDIKGQYVTITCCLNDVIYTTSGLIPSTAPTTQTDLLSMLINTSPNTTNFRLTYQANYDDVVLNFFVRTNTNVKLSWVKCEINNTFTGYYNSEYISNKLSAYNFSNYYYQYDIDTSSAITSDKYYYPNKFSLQYDTWLPKVWGGLNNFNGNMVWSDGVNTYYSNGNQQYVLDVVTSNWVQKTWNGFSNLVGYNVWTDGTNYYYSNDTDQYVLDTFTSTWNSKTWYGVTSRFEGHSIWTDGTNYYFSYNNEQYVLNVSTSTLSNKTWYGITNIFGSNVWTDGSNYYYSSSTNQYFLSVSTWAQKTWNGLNNFSGSNIWFNGINYCYSNGTQQYILNVSTWKEQIWNGLNNFDGSNVWSNSFGIYYSNGTQQYVLASSLTPVDSSYYYQNGYNDGYNTGYNNGYNSGYSIGEENSGNYTFFSLISSVIDAPIKVLTGLFNFEFLGVNLWSFFTGLFTLALIILIIKLALGGK